MVPLLKDYKETYVINNNEWSLVFKKRIRGNLFGLCDPNQRTILISIRHPMLARDMQLSEIYSTFLHEIMHAWEFEYNITLGEAVVTRLELAWLDFILANP